VAIDSWRCVTEPSFLDGLEDLWMRSWVSLGMRNSLDAIPMTYGQSGLFWQSINGKNKAPRWSCVSICGNPYNMRKHRVIVGPFYKMKSDPVLQSGCGWDCKLCVVVELVSCCLMEPDLFAKLWRISSKSENIDCEKYGLCRWWLEPLVNAALIDGRGGYMVDGWIVEKN